MVAPKCLYETLSLETTATPTEIKKSHRALALLHHPDKNPSPESEETFKSIQAAYDVLSDPREREWYDNHRDDILSASSSLDLYHYFQTSCYTGYDGDDGFYKVYAQIFESIWTEERRGDVAILFGDAQAAWPAVSAFYGVWEAFATKKAFMNGDKWNQAEAPNREIRRLMEKDNKKERAKLKREYNTLVRQLVTYVKKRDPRVVKQRKVQLEERERAEKDRVRLDKEKKEHERDERDRVRKARDEVLEEDGEELDLILEQIYVEQMYVQEDSEEEDEHLFCAACRKPFRTRAQQGDHERSKKHRVNVEKLRTQLEAEDKVAGIQSLHVEEDMQMPEVAARGKRKRKKRAMKSTLVDSDQEPEEHEPESAPEPKMESQSEAQSRPDAVADTKVNAVPADEAIPAEEAVPASEVVQKPALSKREKRKLRQKNKAAASGESEHVCNVCCSRFPSRNKLMQHVSNKGHALHV